MGKGRQPPKLLSRVLRAVMGLHESKGSTVSHILEQIRKEMTETGGLKRNVALQVRKALKYAVEIHALCYKSGKYKVPGKRRIFPIDSLELCHVDNRAKKVKYPRKKRTRPHLSRKRVASQNDMPRKRTIRFKRQRKKKYLNVVKKNTKKKKKAKLKLQHSKLNPNPGANKENEGNPMPKANPSPNDKSHDLDRTCRPRDSTTRHQTHYPEYNDDMKGDDRNSSLSKVPGRPRRPRPPVLPTGRCQSHPEDEDGPSSTSSINGIEFENSKSSSSTNLQKNLVRASVNNSKEQEPMDTDSYSDANSYLSLKDDQ